jgi:hypothetical protein
MAKEVLGKDVVSSQRVKVNGGRSSLLEVKELL